MSQRKGRKGGDKTLDNYTRVEKYLSETTESLELLIGDRQSLTSVRTIEGMMAKLRGIRRSMQRLDKKSSDDQEKFWKLSRRAVTLTVKIAKLLSSS